MEFGLKFSAEDIISYDIMKKCVEHLDGHYELPLLWKNSAQVLPDTLEMARKRMDGLKKRLMRDESLLEKYRQQMGVFWGCEHSLLFPAISLPTANTPLV